MDSIYSVTVFKTVRRHGNHTTTRKVELNPETGHISVSAFTIGPRGGMQIDFPGFSFGEWSLITSNVNDVRAGRIIPVEHLNCDSPFKVEG